MDYKKLLPHVIAVLLMLIISLSYFHPVLEGKTMKRGDVDNWVGMAQEAKFYKENFDEEALWTNSMFSGMPTYQIRMIDDNNLVRKFEPAFRLWLPNPADYLFLYMFGFYLLLVCLKIDPKLAFLGAVAYGFSSYFIIIIEAGHLSKSMALGYMPMIIGGFWLMYERSKLAGGALFALFLALHLRSNHLQITYYTLIILVFMGLFFLIKSIRDKTLPDFAMRTAVAVGVSLLAILPNITSILLTYEYGKYTTRGKTELTIDETGKPNKSNVTSGLDKDYATEWSYGIQETFTFIIPNTKGGATGMLGNNEEVMKKVAPQDRQSIGNNNQYWGNQRFTSGPVYLGVIMVLLFILGMIYWKNKLKWAFLAAAVLALMLGWGRNFMPLTEFFLDYVPGYNKFRTVSMTLVIVQLIIPLVGVMFLRELFRNKEEIKANIKPFLIASGIMTFVIVIFLATPSTFFDFLSHQEKEMLNQQYEQAEAQMRPQVDAYAEKLQDVRIGIFRSDAQRSLVFLLLGIGLIYFYLKAKFNDLIFAGVAVVLVGIDLGGVSTRYVDMEKKRGKYVNWMDKDEMYYPFAPSQADKAIYERELGTSPNLAQLVNQRVEEKQRELGVKNKLMGNKLEAEKFSWLNLNSNYRVLNIATSTFNDSRTSFFHKSIGGYHGAKMKKYQELVNFHIQKEMQQLMGALRQGSDRVYATLEELSVLNMLNMKYVVYNPDAPALPNPNALGNAWFVRSANFVPNADEEILALNDFNPKNEAIIREDDREKVGEFSSSVSGNIQMASYSPREVTYKSNADQSQLAVFSEIFYEKGWNAYVDGELRPHYRVNYTLRGLTVPAGEHEVVFKFEPQTYFTGRTIALISSIFLILFVVGVGYRKWRMK